MQLVVLGKGDRKYEDFFNWAAQQYPGRMAVRLDYNEALSMSIYSGADLFLMPSKSEPCGLSQMIAMRYGTIPIVRETGGLKDTVQPYEAWRDAGNGFSFRNYASGDMLYVIREAVYLYKDYPEAFGRLRQRAMSCDFSWARSAHDYLRIYSNITGQPMPVIASEEAPAPTAEAAPVEEAPVEATPVEAAPVEETPVEAAPAEETPVEAAPVEETPVEAAPVEEAPVEAAPVEEAPVEAAPVETAPVEEAPAQPAPVEAASAEEAPAQAVPEKKARRTAAKKPAAKRTTTRKSTAKSTSEKSAAAKSKTSAATAEAAKSTAKKEKSTKKGSAAKSAKEDAAE